MRNGTELQPQERKLSTCVKAEEDVEATDPGPLLSSAEAFMLSCTVQAASPASADILEPELKGVLQRRHRERRRTASTAQG